MRDPVTRLLQNLKVRHIPQVKKIFVGVVGFTVLLAGVAMIILPGPAFIVIPLGLAILASEFVWARRWLNRAREWVDRVRQWKRRRTLTRSSSR